MKTFHELYEEYCLATPVSQQQDFEFWVVDYIQPLVGNLVSAFHLVINTVGDCHDCWDLSSSDKDKMEVQQALAPFQSQTDGEDA